jgi:hypothetical protein
MINMEDSDPKEQFFSLFPFGELNQSVVISKDDDVLIKDSNGNIVFSGNAEVCLDVVPNVELNIHFTRTDSNTFNLLNINTQVYLNLNDQLASGRPFKVELKHHERQIDCFLTENKDWLSFVFSPVKQSLNGIGYDNTQMKSVVFHLFNFRNTFSKNACFEQIEISSSPIETVHIQHIHLEDDNWIVNIRSLSNYGRRKTFYGCEMTHIVSFEKADKTYFSGESALQILETLAYFFSFAKAAWCNPVCAVGFDSSGSRVWENWSSPRISRSDDISWFDDHHPEQLEELFPRFMSRWCNKEWNDTLKKVMYWYVIANNVNDDAGIILAHMALE